MKPDLDEAYWSIEEVAAYLGVEPATVTGYRKRNQMPTHDRKYGRSFVWRPATIIAWHENRPRVGNPAPEPDKPPAADVPAWKMIDMRLSKLACELKTPTWRPPLSVSNVSIRPKLTPLPDGWLVVNVEYSTDITDSSNRTIATLNVTLTGLYGDLPAEEPDIATLDTFVRHTVLPVMHNILREQLHDITMRMGMPPLVIDLFQWTGEEVQRDPSPASV